LSNQHVHLQRFKGLSAFILYLLTNILPVLRLHITEFHLIFTSSIVKYVQLNMLISSSFCVCVWNHYMLQLNYLKYSSNKWNGSSWAAYFHPLTNKKSYVYSRFIILFCVLRSSLLHNVCCDWHFAIVKLWKHYFFLLKHIYYNIPVNFISLGLFIYQEAILFKIWSVFIFFANNTSEMKLQQTMYGHERIYI